MADSVRSPRRAERLRLTGICGAFLALEITAVVMMPPQFRGITAGLLAMVTVVGAIVVAMEVGFKRAALRAADAATRPAALPRRSRERVSPLIQRAYYLARREASASLIARTCDVPEAFAVLIIDDVRRTASGKDRAARDPFGGPHDDSRGPKNPPSI